LKIFAGLTTAIEDEASAALVTVVAAEGSAPREAGARMIVRPSGGFQGTIGGGALEWEAIAEARGALARGRGPAIRRAVLLGPQLGQCCGGRVDLMIETFDANDLDELETLAEAEARGPLVTRARRRPDGRLSRTRQQGARAVSGVVETGDGVIVETFDDGATPLMLFGAGHVGRALTLALAPLPFAVRWIDSRPGAFPRYSPANFERVHNPAPEREIAAAPRGAFILIMTHSHPLDLAIVSAALAAERFGYIGLIGSETKRARFLSQMRKAGMSERMLARLTCPIGVPGIKDKAPPVIAASVAAQLLLARSAAPALGEAAPERELAPAQ
jgi:xanthine dehydrogenase accessory factor